MRNLTHAGCIVVSSFVPAMASPTVPPPNHAQLLKLAEAPDVMEHVRLTAVDESCFDPKRLPKALLDARPADVQLLETSPAPGIVARKYEIDVVGPEAFTRFHDWVVRAASLVKGREVVFETIGSREGIFKPVGYTAICVDKVSLLDGRDMRRATAEKGVAVLFSPAALAKIGAMPDDMQRVVFAHDDTLLLFMVPKALIAFLGGKKPFPMSIIPGK
jgi:hypothetical protein